MKTKRSEIIIFLVIIFIPILVTIFGLDKYFKLNENRTLSHRPNLTLQNLATYPTTFANYFNDNFGLRPFLVNANHIIKLKLLKSSTNKQVTLGKGDWLFYTPEDNYKEVLNLEPWSATDLEQIKTNLEAIKGNFEAHGAKFYLLVAPTSQTIYPEYLPSYLKKVNPQSKLEQLSNYLVDDTKLKLINPTNDLMTAKHLGFLYYRHDLHWNFLGAFFASRSLLNVISKDFSQIKPKPLDQYQITYKPSPQKDLELLLGVNNFYYEQEPILTDKNGQKTTQIIKGDCTSTYVRCSELLIQVPGSKNPKLLMYRDSYGSWLTTFLSDHFSSAHYLWQTRPYSIKELETDKPQIVVWEITEREMYALKERDFAF